LDSSCPAIYTLSLHDALPISVLRATRCGLYAEGRSGRSATAGAVERHEQPAYARGAQGGVRQDAKLCAGAGLHSVAWLADQGTGDRKSTRLNSSHVSISYAVF